MAASRHLKSHEAWESHSFKNSQPKLDEVQEKSPEDYVEMEKTTSVAVNQFIDGDVKWRKKEKIS